MFVLTLRNIQYLLSDYSQLPNHTFNFILFVDIAAKIEISILLHKNGNKNEINTISCWNKEQYI